jgi:hypothetical protein
MNTDGKTKLTALPCLQDKLAEEHGGLNGPPKTESSAFAILLLDLVSQARFGIF